ncbi:monocarboxylate transporter 5-like [Babylonia areolata]|uniref:monocarboxylate transporter 5-like n=1 Tax=Babylonia areolata TaxID=304850 RepID=UPI003FD0ED7C
MEKQRPEFPDSAEGTKGIERHIPMPPDGGWGWVIVFASLFCNFIVDGVGYSFGVFLLVFADFFQESDLGKVSLVGSLLCGLYNIIGPVVSGLINKFGCRPVAVAGSVVAALAFLLSTIAPSVDILILTYGVMGGFGLGMIYLPAIVSVGYYFERKRALATGIAVCGSGIGTIVFAPLSQYLLEELDWKNALYVISGITLNGAVCGMLMRPLKPGHTSTDDLAKDSLTQADQKPKYSFGDEGTQTKEDFEVKVQGHEPDLHAVSIFHRLQQSDLDTAAGLIRVSGILRNSAEVTRGVGESFHSGDALQTIPELVTSPTRDKGDRTLKTCGRSGPATNVAHAEVPTTHDAESLAVMSREGVHTLPSDCSSPLVSSVSSSLATVSVCATEKSTQSRAGKTMGLARNGFVTRRSDTDMSERRKHMWRQTNSAASKSLLSQNVFKEDLARPLYRKDIFFRGSVHNQPLFRNQPDMRSYITSITTIPGEIAIVWSYLCFPQSCRDILQEMLDLSLLKDTGFLLICFGNILAFLGFYVPFVYCVELAVSLGIDKSRAAFLISIIGITNTLGRVVTGWLADLRRINSLVITYISMCVCGLATALFPFCTSYPMLCAVAALFGLSVAAFISLSSILICDLLGLEKLTNGFGLMSLFRGLAAMAGPPLAGFISRETSTYQASFYLGGALLTAGAACHLALRLPSFRKQEVEVRPKTATSAEELTFDRQSGNEMGITGRHWLFIYLRSKGLSVALALSTKFDWKIKLSV